MACQAKKVFHLIFTFRLTCYASVCMLTTMKTHPTNKTKEDAMDKVVDLLMMGNRIALKSRDTGKVDRYYKVDRKFRKGLVSDMKFAGFVPSQETMSNFPWLRTHFA